MGWKKYRNFYTLGFVVDKVALGIVFLRVRRMLSLSASFHQCSVLNHSSNPYGT